MTSGLLDQPTLTDFVSWMNHSVPSDNRDFSRPRERFMSSTAPSDLNNAIIDYLPYSKDPSDKKEEDLQEEENTQEEEEKLQEDKPEAKKDDLVLAFQSFFSKSHPIIGKVYSGPKNGAMNQDLQSAAQEAELKIGQAIGNNVSGMIFSGQKFTTSPADVGSAIALITKHNGKKSSFLTRKERIVAFSTLINK